MITFSSFLQQPLSCEFHGCHSCSWKFERDDITADVMATFLQIHVVYSVAAREYYFGSLENLEKIVFPRGISLV